MVSQSINEFGPKYMYKMFIKYSHLTERILRNTTTYGRLPLKKSTLGQKNFSYRATYVWTSLSTERKEARSIRVLKSFLK